MYTTYIHVHTKKSHLQSGMTFRDHQPSTDTKTRSLKRIVQCMSHTIYSVLLMMETMIPQQVAATVLDTYHTPYP